MQLDSSGGIYDPPEFSLVAELSVSARGDEYAEGTRYCRIPDGWSVPAYFSGSYEELEELELNLREGKTVIVAGRLHVYENATNPGEFDLKTWHSIKRHAFALYDASVVNMAPDCADNNPGTVVKVIYGVKNRLYSLRVRFRSVFLEELDIRDAGLMCAMVLGEKGMAGTETKTLFRDNGMLHIIVISGLHISIAGGGILRFLSRKWKCLGYRGMPFWLSAAVSSAVMILYGIMTGFGMSAFRAVAMFLAGLAARLLHRTYDMPSALALCALLLMITEPYCLCESGFWMGFGAVVCIGMTDGIVKSFPDKRPAVRTLVRSGLFFMGMLPVFLWFNFSFPLYSVFWNLLILPLLELLLPAAFFLAFTGMSGPGHIVPVWIRMVLYFFRTLFGFGEKLPADDLIAGRPALWKIAVYYLILAALLFYPGFRNATGQESPKAGKDRAAVWLLKGVAASAALVLLLTGINTGMRICMLDAGQGECILIRCGGRNILIDAGSSDRKNLYEYQVLPCLKYYGVGQIDILFISHDDSDHINAAFSLVEEGIIKVRAIALPDLPAEEKGENYIRMEKLGAGYRAELLYLSRGDVVEAGPMKFHIVNPGSPDAEYGEKTVNETSQCFVLSYGNFSMLFTGDLEGESQEKVTEAVLALKASGKIPVNTAVYKVAHHGSAGSSSAELINAVSPGLSVISAGRGNRYGHPAAETVQRLEDAGTKILCTKECGAILIRAGKDGNCSVEGFLSGRDRIDSIAVPGS